MQARERHPTVHRHQMSDNLNVQPGHPLSSSSNSWTSAPNSSPHRLAPCASNPPVPWAASTHPDGQADLHPNLSQPTATDAPLQRVAAYALVPNTPLQYGGNMASSEPAGALQRTWADQCIDTNMEDTDDDMDAMEDMGEKLPCGDLVSEESTDSSAKACRSWVHEYAVPAAPPATRVHSFQ